MPLRWWLPLAVLALLVAGLWNRFLPSEPPRPLVSSLVRGQSNPGTGGEEVDTRAVGGAELTPLQVRSIDPERDPQRWREAVDALRARLDRFASDSTLGRTRRREEGEDLLRLVDAFATKNFYLPGQQNQVKLEIAQQIYGDDPELMAALTRDYEAEALQQVERLKEDQRAELARDARFQSFKAQEAALIGQIVNDRPPGAERDAAIASGVTELHSRIYGGPETQAER